MKTISGSRKDHYLIRLGVFLIAVVLIAGMVGCDGDGGYNPPSQNLEIRTWYDLDAVRDDLSASYILMNDLDSITPGYEELASPTANGGNGWQPIGHGNWVGTLFGVKLAGEIFKGTMDGQGHAIRDLYINSQEGEQLGLFGIVAEGAIIKNIAFTINATVTTGEASGEPLGLNEDTVGSLDVAPVWGVGGLVGYNGGTVSNCHATGNTSSDSGMGGLVGHNGGTVSNSSFTGTVSGNGGVGGLVAQNDGTVSNCYYTGNVTGNRGVGGLVGYHSGTMSNSYYNYQEVLINGENIITIGALFDEDFDEWLANDKSLDINERLPQESSYYLINDVSDFKQLLAFGQNNSLKFRLKNDLDLGDEPDFYIPCLAGEFDGNGHKISNLNFNFDFVGHVGLFGYLASYGKVSGLGIDNVNITAASCVGGLIGSNHYGTVSNCYATGSVNGGARVGGLVGENTGAVSRSYSSGSVTGGWWVGGLMGLNEDGTVSNSYSIDSVTGEYGVGGLVGSNENGTVSNCYSTGNVTGYDLVGGLVGWNWESTARRSFWDIETSGQTTSAGGTGKTTAQMKTIATFSGAGWSIIAVANHSTRKPSYIWNIVNGLTYPFLSWQAV